MLSIILQRLLKLLNAINIQLKRIIFVRDFEIIKQL